MGESIRSTVKNAARLAVYELIMISVKNHHMPATIRVETALWWRDVLVAFRYVWFGERREESISECFVYASFDSSEAGKDKRAEF